MENKLKQDKMKRLIFLLALIIIPLMGFSRINFVKVGELVQVTGLTRYESPQITGNGQTLFLANISTVEVDGNKITFMQGKKAVLTIDFQEVDMTFDQTSAKMFVRYLIRNNYI